MNTIDKIAMDVEAYEFQARVDVALTDGYSSFTIDRDQITVKHDNKAPITGLGKFPGDQGKTMDAFMAIVGAYLAIHRNHLYTIHVYGINGAGGLG